jgi:hypothetical protein
MKYQNSPTTRNSSTVASSKRAHHPLRYDLIDASKGTASKSKPRTQRKVDRGGLATNPPNRSPATGAGTFRRRSPRCVTRVRSAMVGGATHAHAKASASGHITLVSSDNQQFVVPVDVAYMSDTVQQMDADGTEDVPLINVDGQTLERVIEYCRFHAPSSRHSDAQMREFDDGYLKRLNNDCDLILRLFTAAFYLDIKPLVHLISKHVACRVVAEWTDSDAVKRAFEVDHDLTARERDGTDRLDASMRRALARGLEIEAKYAQRPCNRAVLYDQATREDMERLCLLEYSLVVPMAHESALRRAHDAPRSRLASMLLRLPSHAVGLICEHFTEPTPPILDIIRGRENKFDHLLRNLRDGGLLDDYVNSGVAFYQNFRFAGPTRMERHDDDPDSDDDWDAYEENGFNSESTKCNEESCGDIVDDNGQPTIVAEWTGYHGKDFVSENYERRLTPGETHEHAKNLVCKMKGCSRCDIALNRCVSNTHDAKVRRREIWLRFLRSHF